MIQSFDWNESTEETRITIRLDGATDVDEADAREALSDLIDGSADAMTDGAATGENERPRRYPRGHTGGEGA